MIILNTDYLHYLHSNQNFGEYAFIKEFSVCMSMEFKFLARFPRTGASCSFRGKDWPCKLARLAGF